VGEISIRASATGYRQRDRIVHPSESHDDMANAVAGAILWADQGSPAGFNRKVEYESAIGVV
jgi:hypothetical protein